MYLIPVTQFLNDVPTSDVSKSVTSPKSVPNYFFRYALPSRPSPS